jgi:bifunctional DNA-binding transcriptional regulator/antitoxin component of YhaV-PrlF toxin-antitoxin module
MRTRVEGLGPKGNLLIMLPSSVVREAGIEAGDEIDVDISFPHKNIVIQRVGDEVV